MAATFNGGDDTSDCISTGGTDISIFSYSGRLPTPGAPDTSPAAGLLASTADAAVDSTEPETPTPTLRLLFSCEDGGMLIGKGGRHIAMLKEAASVSWVVSGNTPATVDRIVAIQGPPKELASAIHALAKHICEQSRRHSHQPVLRLLLPSKSIGAILGPSGSRVSRMRAKLGVTWLHVHAHEIPFTQERIVEIGGTARVLQDAATWIISATMPDLAHLQASSTLYRPVKDGLRQLLLRERQESTRDTRRHGAGDVWFGPSGRGHGEKRPHARLSPGRDTPVSGRSERPARKRPHRDPPATGSSSSSNDSSSSDGGGRRTRRRRSPERPSHRSPREQSATHARFTEEKIVVSDSIAGRLIGRNGKYLLSLEERSGARIVLSPRAKSAPDRIATVAGRPGDVQRACRLIRESIRDFAGCGD